MRMSGSAKVKIVSVKLRDFFLATENVEGRHIVDEQRWW
jgi:hypothetical protein